MCEGRLLQTDKVPLIVAANRANLRSGSTRMDVAAVQAKIRSRRNALKKLVVLHQLCVAVKPLTMCLFDRGDHVKGVCNV